MIETIFLIFFAGFVGILFCSAFREYLVLSKELQPKTKIQKNKFNIQ